MKELITQLDNVLKDKKNILLLTHQHMDGDGLSAMLVLKKYLTKNKDKKVTALCYEDVPETYQFLPGINEVDLGLQTSNDFVISLKCDKAKIDKLKYSVDGDILNIVITPKEGSLKAENISTKKAIGDYDLIFVLDAGDLDHLGVFYEENTSLFYDLPVVNIDHHPSNTGFGQVNFVDITSASTTEILYKIILEMENNSKEFFDEDIATLLLTGLIVDTGSFQHTNTSPKALEFAADLIDMGAHQQEIIQNVYKTKKLSTLKLWGRILSKIKENPVHKIVWSTITKEDLKETGATTDDAEGLIDELMTNAPGAEVVALIKDSSNGQMATSLRSTSVSIDTLPIAQHFGGGGHKQASGFKQKGHNFNLFVADVIGFIEKYQEKRLNLTPEEVQELQEKYLQKREKEVSKIELKEFEYVKKEHEKRDILSELSEENKRGEGEKEKRGDKEIFIKKDDIEGKKIVLDKKEKEEIKPTNKEVKVYKKEDAVKEDITSKVEEKDKETKVEYEKNDTKEENVESEKVIDQKKSEEQKSEKEIKESGTKKEEGHEWLSESKDEKKNETKEVKDYQKQQEVSESAKEPVVEVKKKEAPEWLSDPREEKKEEEKIETDLVSKHKIEILDKSSGDEKKEEPVIEKQSQDPQSVTDGQIIKEEEKSKEESVNAQMPETTVQNEQNPNWSNGNQQQNATSASVNSQTAQSNPMQNNAQVQQNQTVPVNNQYQTQNNGQMQQQGNQQNTQQVQQQWNQAQQQGQQYQWNNQQGQAQQYGAQQQQVTKEQAQQYTAYYVQQLSQMNPSTAEYAQIYQYYQYYAQLAQTL